MNFNSNLRAIIQASVCVVASLAASVSVASAAERQRAEAQLLDHAEFLCANCFFGASKYYYCFEADNQVLVGYQKTPVLNWMDKSKNDLAPVHPAWAAWNAPGPTVPISYDEKHIWLNREKEVRRGFWASLKGLAFWVSRGDDKRVKLTRSSMRDIFTNSDKCRNADRAKAD